MNDLEIKIAGEIAYSDMPGGTMKKWREIFGITQIDLGKRLQITASTISDYEGNRRRSPGTVVIKRFVEAIVHMDQERGGQVISKLTRTDENAEKFFEVHEFATSMSALDFIKIINGKVVANEDLINVKKIYGYTVIDSLKVILEVPYTHFPRLYGSMSERAFIFTKVSTGRSPMVVVRVTPMKPSVIVLHGIDTVDPLALEIAMKEQIPVITTKADLSKIKDTLNRL